MVSCWSCFRVLQSPVPEAGLPLIESSLLSLEKFHGKLYLDDRIRAWLDDSGQQRTYSFRFRRSFQSFSSILNPRGLESESEIFETLPQQKGSDCDSYDSVI